jgi:glycosyltransferase involved in cell wall biosynthesis
VPTAGTSDAAAGRREDVKVDVCVLTYRRPQSLLRLLGALQELRFPDEPPELRVLVVDNDPEESARKLCEDARSWLSAPLVYIVEKRRGIPQARNAALVASLSHCHFLAFVDDDEVPEPDWLAELLRVQRAGDADAVAGPVLPRFEPGAARWLTRGGLFEQPRHATGARIDYAYTGNVLVRTAALAQMDAFFDEGLALTGSSDWEFFKRFAASGRRIVWADAAITHEWVPASRLSVRWLLARAFRVGCSTLRVERQRAPRARSVAWLLANSCWCIVKGVLLLAPAALRGRAAAVRALRLVWYGAGRLYGLGGYSYEEYRTIHGA